MPVPTVARFVCVMTFASMVCVSSAAEARQSSPSSPTERGPAPVLFAPGVISTGDEEFAPTFEPDGKTVYFSKASPGRTRVMWIMVSHLSGDRWTTPEIAPFSGRYTDIDPTLSPDGKQLFFASTRPVDERAGSSAPRADFDLWVVERMGTGWGEPRHLGSPVNSTGSESTTSVTADGTLYFASAGRPGPGTRTGRRLFRSRLVDGRYAEPEALPAPVDAGEEESNQYVSPDGRFMIFLSKRKENAADSDLYLTYFEEGRWTDPLNIGRALNAQYGPFTPTLSRDGKRLYFTSRKGVYDKLPAERVSYERFVETIRSPGNGLGDIYYVEFDAESLRTARGARTDRTRSLRYSLRELPD